MAKAAICALATLCPAGLAVAQGPRTLDDIRACVRANLPVESMRQRVQLAAHDAAGGRRELTAELYATQVGSGRIDLMLDIRAPRDLHGARYLLLERERFDDIYVFLPAVGKARRVLGGMRGQPLWGTDFSYHDIKHLLDGFRDNNARHVGDGMLDQRPVHHLLVEPGASAHGAYRRIEVDLDQYTCLLLEARYYDAAGLSKRMRSDPARFSRLGDRWLAGFVTIDQTVGGTRSSMALGDIAYDEGFSRNRFNPGTFHRVQ